MTEPDPRPIIEKLSQGVAKFPDGRINWTGVERCPVVTIFVKRAGKLFLAKRSDKVATYQGKWNTIAGYLDRLEPLQAKVFEELAEELGVTAAAVITTRYAPIETITDPAIQRTWVTFPVLAELAAGTPIVIDWEHTEYHWIYSEELRKFDLVPGVLESYVKLITQP